MIGERIFVEMMSDRLSVEMMGERSHICWDDGRAIATGFSVGVLIIEKVKKHKEQFKTPCVVQGLGTTWENWVSQSWSNIAM
jgi:hypothetical protein